MAGLALLGVRLGNQEFTFWRGFLILLALVLVFFGFLQVLDWIAYKTAVRISAMRQAQTITPEIRLLETLSRIRPEQWAFAVDHGIIPVAELLTTTEGVSPFLRVIGGELVPLSFVSDYMNRSADRSPYLLPVRVFSHGSRERDLAQALVNHLVTLGMAEEARGNLPPRLIVSPVIAYRRLGLGLLFDLDRIEESAS